MPAGAAARIAGVLHLAGALPQHRKKPPLTLTGPTAEAAVRLARDYRLPHARHAFGVMGIDRRTDDALAVLAWLRRYAGEKGVPGEALTVTRRQIFQNFKSGRFSSVSQVDGVLALLAQHGWIRPTGGAPKAGASPGAARVISCTRTC